jgi:rhamnose transport system permease protein
MANTTDLQSSTFLPALRAILASPEFMVAALLGIAFVVCYSALPHFRNFDYLLYHSSLVMEVGVMAVGMSFVIVGGHVDLSCASILALVGTVITTLAVHERVPFGLLIVLAPLMGLILGGINGLVIARLGIPSLVVTLGTMAVYRGLAQVLVGDRSEAVPGWFAHISRWTIPGTSVATPLVVFLLLAVVLGLVLHRTVFGRWVFAMGTNPGAALYAGVPVAGVTIGSFMLSGVLSAVAALLWLSHYGGAQYKDAQGKELDVITAVVLGGTSIFGGRGSMFGTVAALLLLFILQTGMGLANFSSEAQLTANGGLLIFAVLATNGLAWLRGK